MDFSQILASLTTTQPHASDSQPRGQIAKGMDADLVVLDGDPAKDVTVFPRFTSNPQRTVNLSTTSIRGHAPFYSNDFDPIILGDFTFSSETNLAHNRALQLCVRQ